MPIIARTTRAAFAESGIEMSDGFGLEPEERRDLVRGALCSLFAVIRVSREDGLGAVELFGDEGAHQHMRPGLLAQ